MICSSHRHAGARAKKERLRDDVDETGHRRGENEPCRYRLSSLWRPTERGGHGLALLSVMIRLAAIDQSGDRDGLRLS